MSLNSANGVKIFREKLKYHFDLDHRVIRSPLEKRINYCTCNFKKIVGKFLKAMFDNSCQAGSAAPSSHASLESTTVSKLLHIKSTRSNCLV